MRSLLAAGVISAALAACGGDVSLGTLKKPDEPPLARPPSTIVDQDRGDACARDVCACPAHRRLDPGISSRSLRVGRFS